MRWLGQDEEPVEPRALIVQPCSQLAGPIGGGRRASPDKMLVFRACNLLLYQPHIRKPQLYAGTGREDLPDDQLHEVQAPDRRQADEELHQGRQD